ncbi:hypothetical protein AB0C52_35700 [Streptomyces sp. NPDC048717]|uniref:hypothetical protein n=1 Tax=Streptomyces sp. NPDC048717 TaxID=3154928 RepID=UPI00342AEC1D
MRATKRLRSRLRSGLAACAVAAGTLLAAVSPGLSAAHAATPADVRRQAAVPLSGVQIVKTSGTIDNFTRQSAYCPNGKVAVSGGGEVTTNANPYPDNQALVGSFPMYSNGTAIGWSVNARSAPIVAPMTVTTYAVCATAPSGYEVLRAAPPGQPLSVPRGETTTLTCPTGKIALGGGGEVLGAKFTGLSKSFPTGVDASGLPTKWTVGAYNQTRTTQDVYAFVVCSDPVQNLTYGVRTETSGNPVGGLLLCAPGKQIISGGVSVNQTANNQFIANLVASRPGLASEGAVRDGWWIQAGSIYEPMSADLYVMCL